MSSPAMTRRGFVKAAALTGAVAALGIETSSSLIEAPEAFAASGTQRTAIRTCCHGCIQCCPCIGYLEDGVIVKLEGDPEAPVSKGAMCLKGMAQQHTAYSPLRILYPMKRVGERGAANASWERISWDEAIDLAADQFITSVEKYGPYGVWMGTGGGGQYVSPQGQIFPKMFGGPIQLSGGALQCFGPRRMAGSLIIGKAEPCLSMADSSVVEPFNEYNPTMEVCVIWGASPSTSQTAQSGHGMADARVDRGVKTVVIDPFMIPDATKADVWLPIRPGSDTALVLCFMRYVIENNLIDEQFCKYWTNLPFLMDPDGNPILAEDIWPDYKNPAADPNDYYSTPAYVCFDAKTNKIQPFPYTAPEDSPVDPVVFTEVEIDGKTCKTAGQIYWEEAEPWTLEQTAETCWLKADAIEKAIRLYGEAEHAGIAEGVFADMQQVSSNVPIGILALECMMGYINKPGCTLTFHGSYGETRMTNAPGDHNSRWGLGWTYGLTENGNKKAREEALQKAFGESGKDPEEMSKGMLQILTDRLGSDKYRGSFFMDMAVTGGIREAAATGEPYRPRILFEVSGNKMCTIANTSGWDAGYRAQDFIVQQYTNFTSFTMDYVDLILPDEEWAEYNSFENLNNQINYNWLRQRMIHLGETVACERPFMAVAKKIAEKKGEDFFFDFDYLYNGNSRVVYDDPAAKKALWAERFGAQSWDDLIENYDNYAPLVQPDEEYWSYYQHEAMADDGLPVGFATESRKTQPYVWAFKELGKNGGFITWPYKWEDTGLDYSPICRYVEFEENGLQNDTDYPLVFTSGRVQHFHHGTLRHAPFNRELSPVPDCYMHPDTAASYGIEHGDWVKLTSRRGTAYGRAYLTRGINPRVVREERFWYPELFDDSRGDKRTGGWEYGISNLTRDDVNDPIIGSATYRGFNVQIEKAEKPEGIWTEPKQFEAFLPTLKGEPQTDEVVF